MTLEEFKKLSEGEKQKYMNGIKYGSGISFNGLSYTTVEVGSDEDIVWATPRKKRSLRERFVSWLIRWKA